MRSIPTTSFLSTLSLRRATSALYWFSIADRYFYPRSPCGERLMAKSKERRSIKYFYPRSPCGERPLWLVLVRRFYHFYPRSPCGERRRCMRRQQPRFYFYPRSPCGERQMIGKKERVKLLFLSTLSLRRATAKVHKTVGHFCAYETNFMEIASSC